MRPKSAGHQWLRAGSKAETARSALTHAGMSVEPSTPITAVPLKSTVVRDGSDGMPTGRVELRLVQLAKSMTSRFG